MREEGSVWSQDLFGQGDVDGAVASALPSSPRPVQGTWVQLTLTPTAWGKLLRKVKVVVARPPEISSVWTRGWEGPENNVGARTLRGRQGFQARCRSSSPLPGTAPAGVTLSPGPQGRLPWPLRNPGHWLFQGTAPVHLPPDSLLEAAGLHWAGAPSWCKEGGKHRIWVKVLTLPPTSCVALSKLPCHSEARLSHR